MELFKNRDPLTELVELGLAITEVDDDVAFGVAAI